MEEECEEHMEGGGGGAGGRAGGGRGGCCCKSLSAGRQKLERANVAFIRLLHPYCVFVHLHVHACASWVCFLRKLLSFPSCN